MEIGDLVENFLVFGKTKGCEFRENSLAVNAHLEGPSVSLVEACNQAEFFFDRGLQTCSLGQIVSFNTIFDADIHVMRSLLLTMFPLHTMLARQSSHFRRWRQVGSGRFWPVRGVTTQ